MPFTDKDIETILKVALGKASQFGVDSNAFESLYRASVAEVVERKAHDVSELYASLQVEALFVESFQMGRKKRGNHSETDMNRADWNQIQSKINTKFGTDLADSYRGDNKVYIWLEKAASGKGVLHSYGNAHQDSVGRTNMHYFVIVADFDTLNRVVDSFADNPRNITTFTSVGLGWKNVANPNHFDGEPDLYTLMKELYLHTPDSGQKKVKVT